MSLGPEDAGGEAGRTGSDDADRVLLLAMSGWAPSGREGGAADASGDDPRSRLLDRLEPSWAGVCSSVEGPGRGDPIGRDRSVRGARTAPAGPPGRGPRRPGAGPSELVGPRLAGGVAVRLPGGRRGGARVRSAAGSRRSCCSTTTTCGPIGRPIPQVLAWALLALDRAAGRRRARIRPDDPPVIAAMSGLSPRAGYRLCRYAGEIKLALGRPAARPEWPRRSRRRPVPEFAAIAAPRRAVHPGRRSCPRDGCRPGSAS